MGFGNFRDIIKPFMKPTVELLGEGSYRFHQWLDITHLHYKKSY